MSQAGSRVLEDRRQSRGLSAASGRPTATTVIGRNAICKKCPFSAAKLIHLASKDMTGRTKVSQRDTPKLNRKASIGPLSVPVPVRVLPSRPSYALRKPPS